MNSKHRASIGSLIVLAIVYPSQVRAELYECAGVWKNSPCAQNATQILVEKPLDPRLGDPTFMKKRELIRRVYAYEIDMRKRFVDVDVKTIEEYCSAPERSVEECAGYFAQKALVYEKEAEEAERRMERLSMRLAIEDARRAARAAEAEAAAARAEAESAAEESATSAAELRNLKWDLGL